MGMGLEYETLNLSPELEFGDFGRRKKELKENVFVLLTLFIQKSSHRY